MTEALLVGGVRTPFGRFAGSLAGSRPHDMAAAVIWAPGRTGWTAAQVDAIELNEAFAARSLACLRRPDLDDGRVIADGGARALGHSLGGQWRSLLITLLGRVERSGHRGLASMCVGVGVGVSLFAETL